MKKCTYCGKEFPDDATSCPLDEQPLVFTTPQPTNAVDDTQANVTVYASFLPRFCAGFIDGLVFIPLSFADGFLSAPERAPIVIITWGIITYSSYWLYSVLLHARYGQTLGKMAVKIKVLDVSEESIPTLRQAFLRDIGYIILNTLSLFYLIYLVIDGKYGSNADVSSLPGRILGYAGFGWFLLEVITMLTNKRRRAFHDYIAGTVVIRIPAVKAPLAK